MKIKHLAPRPPQFSVEATQRTNSLGNFMIFIDDLSVEDRLNDEEFASLSESEKEIYLDRLPYFEPDLESKDFN